MELFNRVCASRLSLSDCATVIRKFLKSLSNVSLIYFYLEVPFLNVTCTLHDSNEAMLIVMKLNFYGPVAQIYIISNQIFIMLAVLRRSM